MHQLSDYRIDETLGPSSQPLRTLYAFQSPDRLSYQLSTGGETVIIGSVRYSRSTPSERWVAESTLPINVPDFAWDSGQYRTRGSSTQVNQAVSRWSHS